MVELAPRAPAQRPRNRRQSPAAAHSHRSASLAELGSVAALVPAYVPEFRDAESLPMDISSCRLLSAYAQTLGRPPAMDPLSRAFVRPHQTSSGAAVFLFWASYRRYP